MTISSTTVKNSYSGNGSNDTFVYGFKIFANTDLQVIIRSAAGTETTKTLTTHYTVTGVGSASGGNVVFTAGNIPTATETVVLIRNVPQTQAIDYIANDPFPAETHEEGLDRATMTTQQVQEELNRSIKLSRTNTMTSTEFTVGATERANKILAFDSAGEISVTQELGTYQGTDATTTTEAYVVRDIVKSTTAAQLNNVYICIADSVVGDLLTDTDHFELLVDAVSAATSATSAASSASAAATSATNAATSASNAATSESNASTSESNASTSETNAATSATNAATSATSASTSATSATASATTATTKASEASTSATNAATSETNAATSATNASTSETNAATSATTATTKASEASTSATNAATSETNASNSASASATSAAEAAASADAFDDVYLGSKSSDPTTDNDGDALAAGMLYYNTSSNIMRIYSGSAWENVAVSTSGFATLTGVETLTNKTLTSPKINEDVVLSSSATELNKLDALSRGSIIYGNSSAATAILTKGSANTVLTSDGTDISWQAASTGRTGTVDWCTTAKTSPFTSVSGNGYFVNTTSGSVTVTLPASPSAGDIVSIKDYANTFDTNNVTVGRNSSKIGGECLDATLSTEGDSITLVYVDATQGWLNIQTDDTIQGQSFVAATGGTVTTCGDFKIHTFTASGCFAVSNSGTSSGSNTVDYLVVAGGGGGAVGECGGGGAGAGGYRESSGAASGCYSVSPLGACVSALPVAVQTYPITIGAGGAGGTANPYITNGDGDSGSPSIFSTITSAGGGGAGGGNQPPGPVGSGKAGGSGGGGSGPGGGPVSGANFGAGNTPPVSPPQGNNGGNSVPEGGGGGGGATAVGGNASSSGPTAVGGAGGAGGTSSINTTPTARAGGGGGSGASGGSAGSGGLGGGAAGQNTSNGPANAGTVNTGGGGGGTNVSPQTAPGVGGAGGSGIVIIRYKFQ